ncbi:MAG: sulfotransferase [Candidatus Aminicenantes bacterium]|nr:sulfotransferase [Candidatus Aminicenantes bacterium]
MFDPRAYWGRYEDIRIQKPIFFLGVQCSGLTLVSRMLRRHPAVVSVTGNRKYWSGADEMHTVLGPILPAELAGTRYKVPFADHPVYTPPRSWTYACDELLPYYRKSSEDANPAMSQKFKRVLRMLMARHALDKSEVRFTDKSQVYTVRVPMITALLRGHDPKFILIVMNPYSLCYKAAMGKAADMKRLQNRLSFEKRLEVCAQHWSNSMQCALDHRATGMKIVRFEDLLRDPACMMREICEFVELSFDEDLLPQPHHRIPLGSRFLDRWYPLEPERDRGYLEQIRKSELDILESRCGKLAEELGYGTNLDTEQGFCD